jgi:hypothetical protein
MAPLAKQWLHLLHRVGKRGLTSTSSEKAHGLDGPCGRADVAGTAGIDQHETQTAEKRLS